LLVGHSFHFPFAEEVVLLVMVVVKKEMTGSELEGSVRVELLMGAEEDENKEDVEEEEEDENEEKENVEEQRRLIRVVLFCFRYL
jgi:hypothetical protein